MEGKRYAVLIGCGTYSQDGELQALRCPPKDVDALKDLLESEDYGYFSEISVLKDAPHYECTRTMLKILKSARMDDLVLIYYSGHGKLGVRGGLHLATADTEIRELEATSIPVDSIRNFVQASSTRKIILILDCCYSGRAGTAFLKSGVEDQLQQVQESGIYILTASSRDEVAQERDEDEYSLFTKYILEGIQEGKADVGDKGFVSIDDIYSYSEEQMRRSGLQKPMRWDLNRQGDSLVIARTGKASGEKLREQTRDLLADSLKNHLLPSKIMAKALDILDLENDELSPAQAGYRALLDDFGRKKLNIADFLFEWRVIDQRIADEVRRKEIALLYRQAQIATSEKDWKRAADNLDQVLAFDSNYADASTILAQAQKQINFSQLYSSGLEHYLAGRWAEALSALTPIQAELSDYEDVIALVETAQRAMANEEKARQQAEEVNALYLAAEGMVANRDWQPAVEKLKAILEIAPAHELASQKLREVRGEQLGALYDEGKQHYDSKRFPEATACFRQIAEVEDDYRDIKTLHKKIAEAERLQREAEEKAAWRAKEELDRFDREDAERRKAEAAALRRTQQEAETARKKKETQELAERQKQQKEKEGREQAKAPVVVRWSIDEKKKLAAAEALRTADEKKKELAAAEAQRKADDEKKRLAVNDQRLKLLTKEWRPPPVVEKQTKAATAAQAVRPPIVQTPSKRFDDPARITTARGCAFTILTVAIGLFGLTGYAIFLWNFSSLGAAFLSLVATIVLGAIAFVTLVGAIIEFTESGKALCPNCGEKLSNLSPTTNDCVFCEKCHTYLEGKDHLLGRTDENRIADSPIFKAHITKGDPFLPEYCCVCGKPAVRRETIAPTKAPEASGQPNLFVSLNIPHCAEHEKGAVFEESGGKTYLKFRSLAYWKTFCKLNKTFQGS